MDPHSPDFAASQSEMEGALEEALGEDPRAEELRQMHAALMRRRELLAHDLDVADEEKTREQLRRDIAKLDEQLRVLREEAEITQFVEDAVRVGIEMRKLQS